MWLERRELGNGSERRFCLWDHRAVTSAFDLLLSEMESGKPCAERDKIAQRLHGNGQCRDLGMIAVVQGQALKRARWKLEEGMAFPPVSQLEENCAWPGARVWW